MAYQPKSIDIDFAKSVIKIVKDGGIWVVPASGLAYELNKQKKTLTLTNRANGSNYTVHLCNIEVFRAVGYTVLDRTTPVENN